MTFSEARDEMRRLFPGRYQALYYELVTNSEGETQQCCRLYLDPGVSTEAVPTWDEAMQEMRQITKIDPAPDRPVNGMPE